MSAKELIPQDIKEQIIKETLEIRQMAYCPYSKFQVGAVIIDSKGNKYKGVNVENCSYGLTICAERNAICTGVTNGMEKIKYICVTGDTDAPISPCGTCRQCIFEFSNPETVIIMTNIKGDTEIITMEQLLPYAFSQTQLEESQQRNINEA